MDDDERIAKLAWQELQRTPRTLSGKFSFPTAQARSLQSVLQVALQLFKRKRLEDALLVLHHPLALVGPYKMMVTDALSQVHTNQAHMLACMEKLPLHRLDVLECLALFKKQLLPDLTARLNDLIAPREQFCRLRYHDLAVAKLFMFTSTVQCKLGRQRLALSARVTALKACYHDFIITHDPESRLLAIDNVFALGRILCLEGKPARGALCFLFYSLSAPTYSDKSTAKKKQAVALLRKLDEVVQLVVRVMQDGPTAYARAILAFCRAQGSPSNLVWFPNQPKSLFVEWVLEAHKMDFGSDVWPWTGMRERRMVWQKLQTIPEHDYCALQALYQETFVLLREYDIEVHVLMGRMAHLHRAAGRYDAELPLRRRLLQHTWTQRRLGRKGTDTVVTGALADIARCQAQILHGRHGGKNHELAASILEMTAVCPTGVALVAAYCTCCLGRYRESSRWLCRYLETCSVEEKEEEEWSAPLKNVVVDMLTRQKYI